MKNNIIPINNIQDVEGYLPKGSISLSLPGKPLVGKERYSKIYHTTSLHSFMLIWAKKRLKFSPLTGVNDMKEISVSIINENPRLIPMLFAARCEKSV